MTREEIKNTILANKVVAVIRMKDPDLLLKVIDSIVSGGVVGIELTLTIPKVFDSIEKAAKEFGDFILLGVGSVTKPEQATRAIDAGARFVVSPIYNSELVTLVQQKKQVAIPGGFTPTEIQKAYEQGADFVKIFPADSLGMSFIKSVKAPLPGLQLIPTGGVTLENANEWIAQGASAVGIGSSLVDNQAIENGNFKKLLDNAKKLCSNLGLS